MVRDRQQNTSLRTPRKPLTSRLPRLAVLLGLRPAVSAHRPEARSHVPRRVAPRALLCWGSPRGQPLSVPSATGGPAASGGTERGESLREDGRSKDRNVERTAARPSTGAARGFLAVHSVSILAIEADQSHDSEIPPITGIYPSDS